MTKNNKKILVISFSWLHRDPRVYRQLLFLKDQYEITAAGFSDPGIEGVKFIEINCFSRTLVQKLFKAVGLKLVQFEKVYWADPTIQQALFLLKDLSFDLIIANDIRSVPLTRQLCDIKNAKAFLDAHEYTPRQHDDKFEFRFFWQKYWDYLCKINLPHVNAMTTVCDGLANEYHKNYGISCKVVTNAPFYSELTPSKTAMDKIRMIHHGMVNPSRKLENMITLMDHLDNRFSLEFMLVNTTPSYLNKLQRIAKSNPSIIFRDPVQMPDITETINEYDIGLYCIDPAGFNNKMSLPNKFFEFIQGRLAVAIWPSQEMAKIVNRYKCGVVSNDFTIESMAAALNSLTLNQINNFKLRSHEAAMELCAEKNRELILKTVKRLLNE